jgi:hypothetical protein
MTVLSFFSSRNNIAPHSRGRPLSAFGWSWMSTASGILNSRHPDLEADRRPWSQFLDIVTRKNTMHVYCHSNQLISRFVSQTQDYIRIKCAWRDMMNKSRSQLQRKHSLMVIYDNNDVTKQNLGTFICIARKWSTTTSICEEINM